MQFSYASPASFALPPPIMMSNERQLNESTMPIQLASPPQFPANVSMECDLTVVDSQAHSLPVNQQQPRYQDACIGVKSSISLKGMYSLIKHLQSLGMKSNSTPNEVVVGTTSHQLQTFFRQQKIDPKTQFPQFYAERFPDVAVTYQWSQSLDLLLDELKKWEEGLSQKQWNTDCLTGKSPLLEKLQSNELTFWVDIFFVNQTGMKDVTEDLRIANEIYQKAFLHVALGSETLL
eukprot:3215688-Rhodomonas_salina.3